MEHRVIARAFMGEPLERIALAEAGRAMLLANPDRLEDVRTGRIGPVGFPMEDVFEFDGEAFKTLRLLWRERGRLREEDWSSVHLRPADLRAQNN
jgi:hypothetical protein